MVDDWDEMSVVVTADCLASTKAAELVDDLVWKMAVSKAVQTVEM